MDKQNKQTKRAQKTSPPKNKITTKNLDFVFGHHHCGNDVVKNV
jgi:hypothetical protein